MGKRKQAAPQKTTEEKRQCLTWNMLDGGNQSGDMTVIPDNDPSLIAEQDNVHGQHKSERKIGVASANEDIARYKNEDLKDIYDLHIETCLFHLTGYLDFQHKEDDWVFELGRFKINFAAGPLFQPLPIKGLPDTKTCTLSVSAEGEKSVLSFEKCLGTYQTKSNKKKGKFSKQDAKKEIQFWLVDIDLPNQCLSALKCKSLLLVLERFDTVDMNLTFKIVGTESVLSDLSFPSEALRPRQHNISLKTLMPFFYRIVEPNYDDLPYNKKHDIDEMYACIKERHNKQECQPLPGIQHVNLLPTLRLYQQQAITWMVKKEKPLESNEKELHSLYAEFTSLDGKVLYYNKYSGTVIKDRPSPGYIPTGGILADEMGLGKTVEVLGCMLHNPRGDVKMPDILPIKEDEPMEESRSKKRKKKKKVVIESDSDDSDCTVLYTEYLLDNMATEQELEASSTKRTETNELSSYETLPEARGKNIFTEKPNSHSGEFECICGVEVFRRRKKRKNKVNCVKCGLVQHAECVNYDLKDPHRGEFMCPHCHVESKPVPSGATLIISPSSIADQWVEEILKHVAHESINVFMYTGVNKQGFIQPQTLARQDIVITSYETLRKEIDYVDLPHSNSDTGRRLRHPKRFMAIPSPIIAVEWWRICLDEAQMVECTTTKTAEMALRLTAVNRWCVTGTPIQKSLEDLYGLLLFLGIDPYWVQPWWNKLLYEPYCYGNREPMLELLTSVMWRNMKKDVLDQINIPEQTEIMNWLTFSPVEDHFYRRQYRDCVRLSMERLGKWTDSSTRLSSLDRHTVNQLLYPLLRLRQACCHPQAVRGEFLPIQKTTMTMEELLESLTNKAKLEAEESHRLLIAAINGQAGLCIIQEQLMDAVDRYREVLRSIEEQKDLLHTDKLQQLHAMFNLQEILQSKPEGVAPTLRDDQLQTQIQELKDNYMAKAIAYVKETGDALSPIQFEVKQLQREFLDGSEWWLEIILWAVQRDKDETLVLKIKDDLLENTDNQLRTSLRSCRNSTGLQYVMHAQLAGIESTYSQVLKVMKELEGEPSQDLINKTVECCLRPIDEVLKNCPFCKSEELFEAYESKLFFFVEKGVEVGGMDQGYSVNVNRQGTWADSEVEKALKTILSFAKGCRVEPDLIEYGNTHIKLLDAMKKEFKKLRTHWAGIKEHVASFDEIDMSTTRLRLRLPHEPVPETPHLNVLEKSELTQHKLKLASERIVAQGEMRKKLGQLLYLKNLAKTKCGNEEGDNPELCPICQAELGKEWSVMQCGHCFCLECIRILVERASFGRRNVSVKCAICRQSTHQGEISYVTTKRTNAVEDIWVKGSHSTKVEAVVKCLLKIKNEDSKAKTLVFSTWTDVLSVIATALEENNISYKALYTAGKFQHNLSAFKQSDEGTTLLLPVHSGANGLNLIEATHVILVEPILNPAQELQAIGRVHRIGQTRPTKVHRFLIRGTIEQKMHMLIKSLDTHGLSKNSEDSALTIGDLSSLFSQQVDEGTEQSDEVQHISTVEAPHINRNNSSNNDNQSNHVRVDEIPGPSGLCNTSNQESVQSDQVFTDDTAGLPGKCNTSNQGSVQSDQVSTDEIPGPSGHCNSSNQGSVQYDQVSTVQTAGLSGKFNTSTQGSVQNDHACTDDTAGFSGKCISDNQEHSPGDQVRVDEIAGPSGLCNSNNPTGLQKDQDETYEIASSSSQRNTNNQGSVKTDSVTSDDIADTSGQSETNYQTTEQSDHVGEGDVTGSSEQTNTNNQGNVKIDCVRGEVVAGQSEQTNTNNQGSVKTDYVATDDTNDPSE